MERSQFRTSRICHSRKEEQEDDLDLDDDDDDDDDDEDAVADGPRRRGYRVEIPVGVRLWVPLLQLLDHVDPIVQPFPNMLF